MYMDKDLRTLLGKPVKGKFANRYCGGGDLAVCRATLWAALEAAGGSSQAAQGADPDRGARRDRGADRFAPGLLPYTMRYTNRPTGSSR